MSKSSNKLISIPKKMLNAILQETKDELIVYLINNYKERLIVRLKEALSDKDFDLETEDIEIKK